MNAKQFLEECKSDWVRSLNTSQKILLANLMERYTSASTNHKTYPLTTDECFEANDVSMVLNFDRPEKEFGQ